VLGRDVIAVGRQPAEVGRALLDQRQPPVGEVRRDLNAHVRHEPPGLTHEHAHVVERDLGCPRRQRQLHVGLHASVSDLGGLSPVVARVRHEVLEDHLLQVAVLRMHRGERLQSGDPLLRRLADPHEDPARERDPQLAGRPDRVEPARRVLRRRALMRDQVGVHRFEHQPLRRRDLAQPRKVLARRDADVRVRQHPAVECALARPGDVRGEVGVAIGIKPARHLVVHLRLLAGQHEQLLHVAAGGVVQHPLDVVRRVQVRPVRRERAVLAVALARPRQRQREVA
jgi:hypothetical protein